MDTDQLMTTIESDAVQFLASRALGGIVAKCAFFGLWWINPILGWILSAVIGLGVKYGDWFTYMAVDNWKNTQEGEAYADAASKNAALPVGDPGKAAATQAQTDAFDTLMGVV